MINGGGLRRGEARASHPAAKPKLPKLATFRAKPTVFVTHGLTLFVKAPHSEEHHGTIFSSSP